MIKKEKLNYELAKIKLRNLKQTRQPRKKGGRKKKPHLLYFDSGNGINKTVFCFFLLKSKRKSLEIFNLLGHNISESRPYRWTAPESLSHLEHSKASDVWMVGHLLFEVIGCFFSFIVRCMQPSQNMVAIGDKIIRLASRS